MQTFAVTVTRRVDQIGTITIEAEDAAVADHLAASMFHSDDISWDPPFHSQSFVHEIVGDDGTADARFARCRGCREPLAGCNCSGEDWPEGWMSCEMCEQPYRSDGEVERAVEQVCSTCRA